MAQLAQKLWADLSAAQLFADLRDEPTRLMYALSSFSAANHYATQVGGGEAGVASGFGTVGIVAIDTLGVSRYLFARGNGANAGHLFWLSGADALVFICASGAGAAVSSPAYQLKPSDVGRLLLVLGWHDGTRVRVAVGALPSSVTGTAITGYTAMASSSMISGVSPTGGTAPASGIRYLAHAAYQGTPSDAQLQALANSVRTLGDVPMSFAGATVTHRWSLRDELAKVGAPVVSGQTAPASIPDAVTGAAGDAMTRVGSPTVVTIDTSSDGRRTYGAAGFSATNRLQTAAGLGIRGHVAGTWFAAIVEIGSATGTECFASATNTSSGWDLLKYSGTLMAGARSAGGVLAYANSYTFVTSDVGVKMLVGLQYTGSVVRSILRGVQVGADVGVGIIGPATSEVSMEIGSERVGAYPATNTKIYAWAGGDGHVLTADEWLSLQTQFEQTGTIGSIAGKTAHRVDLTADIIANGGPEQGIPAQVLDRVGTDHLSRVGGLVVRGGGIIANQTDTVNAPTYARTAGPSAPGAVSGFYGELLIWNGNVISTASSTLIAASDANIAVGGWAVRHTSTRTVDILIKTSVGVTSLQHNYGGTQSAGLHHIAFSFDGSVLRLYANGSLSGTSAGGITYVSHATEPVTIGAKSAALAPELCWPALGAAYGTVIPTAGEIATAAAAALAAGKIVGVPGHSRRWSIVDDVIEAGGKVPAIIRERVSNVDHMAVVGAPLQVAQRTERVWSYETTPILYGSSGHTAAAYYEAPTGGAGNTLAFGGTLVWTPRLGASATRVLLSALMGTPNRGWDIRTGGANATISMQFANAANGLVSSGIGTLGASFHGKICVYSFQFDGTAGKLATWLNRAVAGVVGGATVVGYAPPTGALRLGADLAASLPGIDSDAFGLALWDGIATTAQVQAQHDAILAADGRIQRMPGVANTTLIDPTLDALASGGALGATLTDRIGTNHFARTGTPTTASQYARAFGF